MIRSGKAKYSIPITYRGAGVKDKFDFIDQSLVLLLMSNVLKTIK